LEVRLKHPENILGPLKLKISGLPRHSIAHISKTGSQAVLFGSRIRFVKSSVKAVCAAKKVFQSDLESVMPRDQVVDRRAGKQNLARHAVGRLIVAGRVKVLGFGCFNREGGLDLAEFRQEEDMNHDLLHGALTICFMGSRDLPIGSLERFKAKDAGEEGF